MIGILLSLVATSCSFNFSGSNSSESHQSDKSGSLNQPVSTYSNILSHSDKSTNVSSSEHDDAALLKFNFENIAGGYALTISASQKATFTGMPTQSLSEEDKQKLKEVKELTFGKNIETIVHPDLSDMVLRKISFSEDVKTIEEGFHYISGEGVRFDNEQEPFYGYYFAGDCPNIKGPFLDDSWPTHDSYIYYEPGTKGWDAFSIQGNLVRPTNYIKPTIEGYTVESWALAAVYEFNRMMELKNKTMEEKDEKLLFLIPNTRNIDEYNEIKEFTIELTKGLQTDEQKCDAIYKWLVNNITYTRSAMNYTAYQTFKEKRGVCAQFTELMRDMMTSLGIVSSAVRCIPNFFITDIEKALRQGVFEDDGETHKLVSVYLNGQTYYYDATWKEKYKTNYAKVAENYTLINIDDVAIIPQDVTPMVFDTGFFGIYSFMAWVGDHLYSFDGGRIGRANNCSFLGNFVFVNEFFLNCWEDGWKGLPKGAAIVGDFNGGDFPQLSYCRSDGLSSNVMILYNYLGEQKEYLFELFEKRLPGDYLVSGDFLIGIRTNSIVMYSGTNEVLTIPHKIGDIEIKGVNQFAISDNNYLKEIYFEEGVTRLGEGVIYNCQNLKKVALPSTIIDAYGASFDYHDWINESGMIEQATFAIARHCLNFEQYTLPANNPYYKVKNGSLYTKDGKILLACPPQSTTLDLEGVEYIIDNACEHCGLESIVFPASIKELGTFAFAYSPYLRSISFLGETIMTDSGYVHSAFACCPFLSNVSLPSKQEVIGGNMFAECFSLTEITLPETIKKIRASAFSGSGLVHIGLPTNLEEIEEYAFGDCENLRDVDNYSSLDLVMGSDYYGGVAKYAKDITNECYTYNKDGFVFFVKDDIKLLMSYIGDISNDTITLPSDINGQSYTVYKTFFHQGGDYMWNTSIGTSSFVTFPLYTPMHYIKKVYVPEGVTCTVKPPKGIEVVNL